MAKCPHCGAEFEYDVTKKSVYCAYCGSEFNPQELKKEVKKAKKSEDVISGKTYSCTQCGATLMTFDEFDKCIKKMAYLMHKEKKWYSQN